ncbi:SusD/RagB family nutrient-binding outer membrane lipoprotein [Cruoricaptor ignavus]|uniref:SusD/RagB family nutrient-binding outer membrane lipoprotein n=1 Tax=Cruoricaptor ignavus TaxID=1118202 RepID=UPI00370D8E67
MKKILSTAIILSVISCTGDFDEINRDETKITTVDKATVGQLYASSQFNGLILNRFRYQTSQSLFGDFYSQYFANFSQSFASDRYTMPGGWLNNTWNFFYQKGAPQIYEVLNKSKELELREEYALALVWKVTMFHRMTDYFGPIPYSSIGTPGKSFEYDSQKDIYAKFFQELNEAIGILKGSKQAAIFGAHDQIYGGDVKKWLKYANTLKLRLAVRISDVNPAEAKKYAEEAVADGVFTDNSEDAWFKATASSNNPIGWTSQWDEYRMSATMESVLVGYNDPRLPIYFQPAKNGEYHGVRNGVNNTQMNKYNKNSVSRIGTFFYGEPGKLQKFIVMPAAEAYFLRAEGALLGWNMNGTARDLYNEGIKKSLQQWGITGAAANTYVNSTATPKALNDQFSSPAVSSVPVKFSNDLEEQKHQVAMQKWLALFPNGWEAWSSLRKSDYPKIYDVINSDNADIPTTSKIKRLQFPGTEYTLNPDGVKTGINALNGKDSGATRLWWDVK